MVDLPIGVFLIEGENKFVELTIEEVFGTSCFGGYDVRGLLNLNVGCYSIKNAELYFATGELQHFCIELEKCYSDLKGTAKFKSTEGNFEINMKVNEKTGCIDVVGKFIERWDNINELKFETQIDQIYLPDAIKSLKNVVSIFGDKGE